MNSSPRRTRMLRLVLAGVLVYGGVATFFITLIIRFYITLTLGDLHGIRFQEAYDSLFQYLWFYALGAIMALIGAALDRDKELPGRRSKKKHAEPTPSSNRVFESDARQDQPRAPQHER